MSSLLKLYATILNYGIGTWEIAVRITKYE
jgi:hypothetical protein